MRKLTQKFSRLLKNTLVLVCCVMFPMAVFAADPIQNLISVHPTYTWVQNGIMVTTNGDGVYKISGTATADTNIKIPIKEFTIPKSIDKGGTGIFALYNTSINGYIRLYRDDTAVDYWSLNIVNRVSTTYATMADKSVNTLVLNIAAGTRLSNASIAPALYINATSAPERFIAGGESRLASEYTELEYIEFTGSQYIDTGIYPSDRTSAEIKFVSENTGSTTEIILGDGWNDARWMMSTCAQTNAPQRIGNLVITRTNYWRPDTQYVVSMSKNQGQVVNGVNTEWGGTANEFVSSNTLLLCGARGASERNAHAKVYYAKIWDYNTLAMDLIPARRNRDNVLGMYDMVTGRFYTNSGTGSFSAGATVGIKIATVNYTNNEFAPLETRLQVVTSRVGSIVSETATQASSIGTLLSDKQNRPNSSCPTGSKCLLVKDVNGNENWYPIVEAPSE